ncbi:MAG: tetratricopeptide repeat protein, partial [Tannerellaceae bacterium]|nr:tetratricopeptide repeat protein [Tannerellaceae bacterium]
MMRQLVSVILLAVLLLTNPAVMKADGRKNQRKFDYFFYEGLNLKNAEKYDAAFEAFNHCLTIDSVSAPVLYELSSFYMQLNRQDKATEMLKRAAANSPGNFTYKIALATLLRNRGMYGEAVEAYEELVKAYPAKTELNYYLADALAQQGEIGKAIDTYNVLESILGMNEAFSMQKYRLYMTLKQPDAAFGEVEKLAAKYPMDSRYPIMLGDLYLERDDKDKAYKAYQKAYETDPTNPYYFVSMANYYEAINDKAAAETQIRDALVNEKLDVATKVNILSRYIMRLQQTQQGTDNANLLFETLMEQHPEETELKLMYGSLLILQKKTDEAKFQFQLVTEMEPENESAWERLLELSLQIQDIPDVIRICTKCIALFPEIPHYYFYLGVAHSQEKQYQEALDAYRKGLTVIPLEKAPLKSDFYGQIGDLYYQMDQLDKTFEVYDEALKFNENNIVVLNNYAYFLSLSNRDLEKAERMSAITIKQEPDNSTYLDTYAWIFFKQGNYTLAKFYLESALEKDITKSPELTDHYGDVLYMSGEKEKAVEQWKKAKEMGKTDDVLNR